MTHRFAELMFTPEVMRIQERERSRASYARLAAPAATANDRLGAREAEFIAARDSFYMATVSATGWRYIQHRGAPAGFIKMIDDRTLGFADYRGNKQYISVGNLVSDDRVSLFLMDYSNRRRLKIVGHARTIDTTGDPERLAALQDHYPAKVERGLVIAIEGFDWNCPQHITPRFTETEVAELVEPMQATIERLQRETAVLRAALEASPAGSRHDARPNRS